MGRTREDALRWAEDGAARCTSQIRNLDEAAFDAPSPLPGWTRKHLVGHLAANGAAVGNLVRWAETGVESPMYTSREQRDADIAASADLSAEQLTAWFERTAAELADGFARLTEEQWQTQVKTALGRDVPATEVPWMRAREVMVHAVDLAAGTTFVDLPADFLGALVDDVVGMRAGKPGIPALELHATDDGRRWAVDGEGEPIEVRGALGDLAAYLTGRDHGELTTPDGSPVPALPAWI